MSNQPHWLRAKLKGTLTVLTPLHIGDGTFSEVVNTQEETTLENQFCRDINGLPYVPSSSYRGALRALLQEGAIRDKLFGYSGEGENDGAMGALRCYDATCNQTEIADSKITRTAIDSRLGVAKEHQLFTSNVVPIGTKFNLEIELDDISQEEIQVILGAIALLSKNSNGLGRSKRVGQGKLHWKLDNFKTIDQESMSEWISSPDSSLKWVSQKTFPEPSFDLCHSPTQASLPFTLTFHSPWLINDPTLVAGTQKDPKLEYSRRKSKGLLPATSFKGWIKHQARRIIQTLLDDVPNAQDITEQWLAEIFGDTNKASWLTLSDAISEEDVKEHIQTFNAVDRFTGGVKDTALYTVRAASACLVQGTIGASTFDKQDWRLGLLALIFRDAMEGDLKLGWGKSKGYGQATMAISYNNQDISSWQQLITSFGSELSPAITALQAKVQLALSQENTIKQEANHV